jgi:hypothetical protein
MRFKNGTKFLIFIFYANCLHKYLQHFQNASVFYISLEFAFTKMKSQGKKFLKNGELSVSSQKNH